MLIDKSYAKINLFLNVNNKIINNLHELDTFIISINFYDILFFKNIDENDVKITINNNEKLSNLPKEENLIYKAAVLFKKKFNLKKGIHIYLYKYLPIGAGLGGGSSNAASVIRNLNKLWRVNYPLYKLEEITWELGSDVTYFLYNKPAYVYGTGNNINILENLTNKKYTFIIFNPDFQIPTNKAYKLHKIYNDNIDIKNFIEIYKKGNIKDIVSGIYNSFEQNIFVAYPKIFKYINDIRKIIGNCFLCGSGSSLFSIIENNDMKFNKKKIKQYCRDEKITNIFCENV